MSNTESTSSLMEIIRRRRICRRRCEHVLHRHVIRFYRGRHQRLVRRQS